ncbi:unnamed protein product [Symbiodinium sp. CCMP2592]|nr:unnamed protein product [Symbiodinium sp. CCMP2592]
MNMEILRNFQAKLPSQAQRDKGARSFGHGQLTLIPKALDEKPPEVAGSALCSRTGRRADEHRSSVEALRCGGSDEVLGRYDGKVQALPGGPSGGSTQDWAPNPEQNHLKLAMRWR